ncbi:MAG: redox-sensitive bicupin YhaK (pirin superfamily) [Alphaproteobacteria bacterium]|jgi:redox-sensitive bicupin YhaK (pirin superfamily)
MDILTYVTSGTLKHKDTMGHEGLIKAGHAQLMQAGTGVSHSEFNNSDKTDVKFLQIWIEPQR